jgi:hypothetical protein
MIANDARCTREIISRIALTKAAFDRKKLLKCYICSTALYGAENWTFRKVDRKYLKSWNVVLEKD